MLVLEYVPGGELFELVAEQHKRIRTRRARRRANRQFLLSNTATVAGEGEGLVNSSQAQGEEGEEVLLTEEVVRRIWGELCKAVGWMHGVGLVHRDIKLESTFPSKFSPSLGRVIYESYFTDILLTTPLPPPALPAPFIKLTDFGLSRFLPPPLPSSPTSSQLLTTLCGSESYASPELVCGGPYDGRMTDAWACGVVLFAVVTGGLPFDRVPLDARARENEGEPGAEGERERERRERKALLVRIASAEYAWPTLSPDDEGEEGDDEGLVNEDVKRVVGRLLVRDWRRRAKIEELWDEEWMNGPGAPARPALLLYTPPADENGIVVDVPPVGGADEPDVVIDVEDGSELVCADESGPELEGECEDADGEGEGILVDGQEIGPESVARQEH